MQLPPFVLIEHPTELKDKTLIMSTTTPYIIGQVWRFTGDDMEAWIKRNPFTVFCTFTDYHMLISSYGALGNAKPIVKDIMDALNGMRDFYHSVRIAPNAPRYNRYKIDR